MAICYCNTGGTKINVYLCYSIITCWCLTVDTPQTFIIYYLVYREMLDPDKILISLNWVGLWTWNLKKAQNTPASGLQYAWWRHQIETFSALPVLCAGNSPATGDADLKCFLWSAPEQTLEQRIEILSPETPSCSLWRHCNVQSIHIQCIRR